MVCVEECLLKVLETLESQLEGKSSCYLTVSQLSWLWRRLGNQSKSKCRHSLKLNNENDSTNMYCPLPAGEICHWMNTAAIEYIVCFTKECTQYIIFLFDRKPLWTWFLKRGCYHWILNVLEHTRLFCLKPRSVVIFVATWCIFLKSTISK